MRKKSKKNRDSDELQLVSRKERVVEMLSLPKDVTLNMPMINLEGKTALCIENYKGIIEYTEESITINTTIGIINITGKCLSIKAITSEDIIVRGRFGSISFKN